MTLAELAVEIAGVDELLSHGTGVFWIDGVGLDSYRLDLEQALATRPAASRGDLAARVDWMMYEFDRFGLGAGTGAALPTLRDDVARLCRARGAGDRLAPLDAPARPERAVPPRYAEIGGRIAVPRAIEISSHAGPNTLSPPTNSSAPDSTPNLAADMAYWPLRWRVALILVASVAGWALVFLLGRAQWMAL